jgi:hypothetical protein
MRIEGNDVHCPPAGSILAVFMPAAGGYFTDHDQIRGKGAQDMKNMKGIPVFSRTILSGALAILICAVAPPGPVQAQEPIVYPGKGQSQQQVEQDKYSCYEWAKGQTGFDPMQTTSTAAATPQEKKGGAMRGAAGGALGGAAIGAIAGDAGKGAAIGAASGGVVGGVRRHRSEEEQRQTQQQAAAGAEEQRATYNRAWGACMEGKGYTVK